MVTVRTSNATSQHPFDSQGSGLATTINEVISLGYALLPPCGNLAELHLATNPDKEALHTPLQRFAERDGADNLLDQLFRYAEEELKFDLLAILEDTAEVEKQIRDATAKHNAFLRELGLPGLPLAEG